MISIACTRLLEWDAAHRVLRHESKCAHLHGHRYRAEVTIEGRRLDEVDRVIDFGVIKARLGAWIDDRWDHGTLVNHEDLDLLSWCLDHSQRVYVIRGEPTAENIAVELLALAGQMFDADRDGLVVKAVRVWETPNCFAEARIDA